jgi:hypothetical protein
VVALVGAGVAASGPNFDLRPYPVALVDHLDERGWIANADVHVVAPDWVGNYLDLRDGAAAQVFVDDRAEVFPAEVHDAHLTLLRDRPGWDDVLDRWDVDVVVWPEGKPLVEYLDADAAWREVERSDGFVALCRVGALDGC